MTTSVRVSELVQRSSQPLRVLNDADVVVHGLAPLDQAQPGMLSIAVASRRPDLRGTRATAVATDLDEGALRDHVGFAQRTWILVPAPRLFLAEIAAAFDPPRKSGVHEQATVDPAASLGEGCSVGAGAVIEAGATIGDRCLVGSNVVIGGRVQLGDDVVVGPGCILGNSGFGLARGWHGWLPLPHTGRVIVADAVRIGANCVIDRGSLADTRLERGVCLSSNVTISHNASIGERSIIAGHSMVSGSARIGADVWLAPSTSISNGVSVGDGAMTGLGAVVVDDVPPGLTVVGSPARSIGQRRHFLDDPPEPQRRDTDR